MRRWTIGALALLILLPATALAAKGKKSEAAVKVDPTFFDRRIERIGLLTVTLLRTDDTRTEMVIDMVQSALQEQGEFEVHFPDDIKSSAERSDHKADYETLMRVWLARRELDPPALKKISEALVLDAMVGVELTHWEQQQIDYTQEGNSTTTVGLKVWMWDARDRTLLWEASLIKTAKSPPYDPSNSVVADAGGGARQGIKNVPAPPEYDDVAQEVVDKVLGTYPKEKSADGKAGDRKKEGKDKPAEGSGR